MKWERSKSFFFLSLKFKPELVKKKILSLTKPAALDNHHMWSSFYTNMYTSLDTHTNTHTHSEANQRDSVYCLALRVDVMRHPGW